MRRLVLLLLIATIASGAVMSVVTNSLRDPLKIPSMHVDHPPGLKPSAGGVKRYTAPPPLNRDEDKLLQCKLIYN
uniref:DekiORF33 n=1 Tax=Dendrolimus kikuchii nucleopolyhedrovirus TaxID=1219875 RepID=V9LSM5_9ABAC|nr:DekiORF33 [Dendrolimus kikuchii nucleopolyhedrovirus]